MQTPLDRFGLAVRKAREERNWSQQELAQRLNMNKNTIMEIELGRSNPKGETLFLITTALHISLDACAFTDGWKPNAVGVEVLDFFSQKDEEETKKYIDLCRYVENLSAGSNASTQK